MQDGIPLTEGVEDTDQFDTSGVETVSDNEIRLIR